MMNRTEKAIVRIGMQFKKAGMILTVIDIKRQDAILHRSYTGNRRILEQIPTSHILNCPGTYKKIENGIACLHTP